VKSKKLSLIIPVYNEEKTLSVILDKVLGQKWDLDLELIIVNDCSKDDSGKIIKSYCGKYKNIKVLTNIKNIGKSQSVKRGILASTGDLVGIQDADLEYNPADLLKIVSLFRQKPLDVVYGNRFGKKNKVVYFMNWIGNRGLSAISSLFTYPRARMWTNDMETCYKVVKGHILRSIAPTISAKTTFGFEPEITAKLSKFKIKEEKKRHIRYAEIPISYYPRTVEEGKKMKGLSDGTKALIEIIKYNLFS
jgi:glycosyltransferase involved in cell wall biosynthesis